MPREWEGETAFLLGGGPSLNLVDMGLLYGRRTIVINNSWELLPGADVLYFCDFKWWAEMRPKCAPYRDYLSNGAAVKDKFLGRVATISKVDDPALLKLQNTGRSGLEGKPTGVRHGGNSGYQAMNLAFHLGVSRIVLLGYDMHVKNGTHWHTGHGRAVAEVEHRMNKSFVPAFDSIVTPLAVAGIQVINCTPGSALPYWPIQPLESAL